MWWLRFLQANLCSSVVVPARARSCDLTPNQSTLTSATARQLTSSGSRTIIFPARQIPCVRTSTSRRLHWISCPHVNLHISSPETFASSVLSDRLSLFLPHTERGRLLTPAFPHLPTLYCSPLPHHNATHHFSTPLHTPHHTALHYTPIQEGRTR